MALTTAFVAAVRRQGSLPAKFTDSDILLSGDIEVQTRFLPLLRRMRAEYGVRRMLLTIANGRVVMPDRSQVAGIRLVQWVQGNSYVTLPQVQPEDDYGPGAGGTPYGWYFDAAGLNIVPSSASGSVLVRYYSAASKMILDTTDGVSQITTVVEGATTVTGVCSPSITAGTTTHDIVSARPAHHVVVMGGVTVGATAYSFSTSAFTTRDSDRPLPLGSAQSSLAIGDYLAPNGQTPFVPLPEELFGALVHRTTGVMLRAAGYLEESGAQLQLADEAETLARDLLAPRSEGTPRALLGGISRATGRRRWRW